MLPTVRLLEVETMFVPSYQRRFRGENVALPVPPFATDSVPVIVASVVEATH
jgi:hypothetical protein